MGAGDTDEVDDEEDDVDGLRLLGGSCFFSSSTIRFKASREDDADDDNEGDDEDDNEDDDNEDDDNEDDDNEDDDNEGDDNEDDDDALLCRSSCSSCSKERSLMARAPNSTTVVGELRCASFDSSSDSISMRSTVIGTGCTRGAARGTGTVVGLGKGTGVGLGAGGAGLHVNGTTVPDSNLYRDIFTAQVGHVVYDVFSK